MNSESVVIDCDSCLVRSASACGDCVVSVLLGGPPQGVEVAPEEMAALTALADEGLVPPLRLVTPLSGPDVQAGGRGSPWEPLLDATPRRLDSASVRPEHAAHPERHRTHRRTGPDVGKTSRPDRGTMFLG